MLARVYSCAVIGLDGVVVEVEGDYTGRGKQVLAKRAEIKKRTHPARRLQNLRPQATEV